MCNWDSCGSTWCADYSGNGFADGLLVGSRGACAYSRRNLLDQCMLIAIHSANISKGIDSI